MESPYSTQELLNCFIEINKNPLPAPMSEEEINRLSFSKYRVFNGETVSIPLSLKIMLGYDKDFMAKKNFKLLSLLFDALDTNTGIIHSTNLDSVFKEYPETENIKWNNFENAPALIPLTNSGDQLVFIYVSQMDEIQEYPVCRLDQQEFSFWMAAASFIHHTFDSGGYNTENYNPYLEAMQKRDETILSNEYYLMD